MLEPLFQGDYLLVMQDTAAAPRLTLHRIVHGMFMQDACEQNATFTTLRYAHVPHPGVPCLFGTFSPLLNAAYRSDNA
eukprot:3746394-Pleurochrysis_carterae.AAC.1